MQAVFRFLAQHGVLIAMFALCLAVAIDVAAIPDPDAVRIAVEAGQYPASGK